MAQVSRVRAREGDEWASAAPQAPSDATRNAGNEAKLHPESVLWLLAAHQDLFGVEHERAAKEIELCVDAIGRADGEGAVGQAHPREYTDAEAAMPSVYANWQDELRVLRIPFWAV